MNETKNIWVRVVSICFVVAVHLVLFYKVLF